MPFQESGLIRWSRVCSATGVGASVAGLAELLRGPHHLVVAAFAAGLAAAPAPSSAAAAVVAAGGAIAIAAARSSRARVAPTAALTVGAALAGVTLGLVRV